MSVRSPKSLTICPATVAKWMCAIVAGLIFAGTIANVLIFQVLPTPDVDLAKVLKRIDIGHEPSVPQVWSSMCLMLSALLMVVIGVTSQAQHAKQALHWFVLAAIFVLLGLDEAVMLHEMVDTGLRRRLDTEGMFHFAWVIPGLAFVAVIGLTFSRFLLTIDSRTARGMVVAGLIFVGGAVGVEMLSGVVVDQWCSELPTGRVVGVHPYGMPAFTLCQAVEEAMEMLGVVVLIYTLLTHLQRQNGALEIHLSRAHVSKRSGRLEGTS